ncbi:uncharacterized protein BX664DRAFT_201146 [Halteromyces radiatus]|uniref:uncharacterized protein n=1 Tax=Halteromyces radiatus TaxID=101107 RepID=UPI00222063AA|nr:uncharacterized protein BX664DRAFT_201146 [Halteromyces radiatus]KAI8081785.1 hypothetical protein BX664DRAFT_201146 [Halteromyces radiatus]
MTKGKRDKPTRKERRTKKNQILLDVDSEGQDLETQLKRLGLTTKCITGDGNCLFRALSDQYYGYDKHHRSIRQEVCQYLQQHKETYQYFVEDDIPFDRYIANLQQDGFFGGHMVIVGFAKLRQVDIKVYQPGMIYVISGIDEDVEEENNDDDDDDTGRQILHIAYHSWEHYSSIRNVDGPYSGMPEIKTLNPSSSTVIDTKGNSDGHTSDDNNNEVSPDSKEKVILNACPGTNIRKIRRLLRKYKGNPDKVIDVLYESSNSDKETKTPMMDTSTTVIDDDNNNNKLISEKEQQQCVQEEEETTSAPSNQGTMKKMQTEKSTPKRISARDRKYQTKMRQKEKQREKKQQLASKHTSKAMNDTSNDTDKTANMQQSMKQLYI